MNRLSRKPLFLLLVVLAVLVTAGCSKLRARDKLNKGVQAYKAGRFEEAIELFKQSRADDPNLINAQLYLATAYASQYIPGAPSEENVRNGEQAVAEFREVLKKDPSNLSAIDGIGSILYNMRKLEESKEYHQRHIRLKPDDPEPYYWVGVIDWLMCFQENGAIRNEYNANARKQIKDTDPLPEKQRAEFAAKLGAVVDDGLTHLEKAVQLRKDYEEALAYQNLLYRQKADMTADPQEREALLTRADALIEQVKAIKQKKLEQQVSAPTQ